MSAPLVYFILGAAGSGRRAVLADLLRHGLPDDARPELLVSADELPAPEDVRARLETVPNLIDRQWRPAGESGLNADLAAEITHLFILADGRGNPVDQIERFHAWLSVSSAALGRIITVVDCQLGERHPELLRWYDACAHFSDVLLLNRRGGVSNKWVSDFAARFRKEHMPCLVEPVKDDQVDNPALVLEPQARRISLLFDSPEEWPLPEEEEVDETTVDGDVADLMGGTDPYLERLPSGRRAREIPDIRRFLPGDRQAVGDR